MNNVSDVASTPETFDTIDEAWFASPVRGLRRVTQPPSPAPTPLDDSIVDAWLSLFDRHAL